MSANGVSAEEIELLSLSNKAAPALCDFAFGLSFAAGCLRFF